MTIDSDYYKFEGCSITGDECCGYACDACKIAQNNKKEEKECQQKEDAENYTTFERENNIVGVKVKVDPTNVIAKIDMGSLKALQEKGIVSKTKSPYHPDYLKQYSEHLKLLRQYNHLGIPDEIWLKKDFPAAFRFGEVIYLIAPRIELE